MAAEDRYFLTESLEREGSPLFFRVLLRVALAERSNLQR